MVNLEPLIPHLPAWLMVLFRLTGVFLYGPLYGSAAIPARVKAMLALGLSFCVYPMLLSPGSASAQHLLPVIDSGFSFWMLAGVVGAELAIGLVIGFGASLPLLGMQWGGRMISQQLGLGLAEVFSPDQEQAGLISELMYLLALLVFLLLGGHRLVLTTLVGTFQSIPPGGFAVDVEVINMIMGLLTSMLHLAMRVAAPLLCLIFLETLAFGFVMRTVPQMNIISVGFPVRIMIGSTLLFSALSVKTNVLVDVMRHMMANLTLFFRS